MSLFYQTGKFGTIFEIHRVYKEQHKPMYNSSEILGGIYGISKLNRKNATFFPF
jgi:hypothetical protein